MGLSYPGWSICVPDVSRTLLRSHLASVGSAAFEPNLGGVRELPENALNIYTDGSQLSTPRRQGGAGFIFIGVGDDGEELFHEVCPPGWKGATNNQMELQACIEALKLASGHHSPISLDGLSKVIIYTDSQYVTDNYGTAIHQWSKSGWKKRGGAPVRNTTQWKELLTLAHRLDRMGKRLEVQWVKGHKKDAFNKRADRLAKTSARTPSERELRPARVRRKLSPRKCEPGCIQLRGQVEVIRLITDEYLPKPHDCYAYMYEVIAPTSTDFQMVDKATSDLMLGAGHAYEVRFNNDAQNPRIEECFQELNLKPDGEHADDVELS
jgi:ribonuclease HI